MNAALQLGCDAAQAQAREPRDRALAHPRLVLATTILASSLAFVDGSVVNVGLPTIGRSLDTAGGDLQWVVNAYLLPLSALLLLGGALGDRYGRRAMLVAGTALFGLASVACALAPTLGWFLAARLIQGAGAAILMPSSLAILGQSFKGAAKGRAIGTWAAAGAAAGAVGPVLGGWVIDLGSWRAIFLINLPIAVAAIVLALRYVPGARDGEAGHLDWLGAVLATAGLGAVTWGLTLGSGAGGWSATAVTLALGGAALLLLFLAHERRLGDRAMMPLDLFGSRSFVGLSLLTFLLYGALGALLVLLPYVLIVAGGYSGTAAGAALLPLPLVLSIASPVMGAIAGRRGSRLPLTVGPLVAAAGLALMLRVGEDADYWTDILPALLVLSAGMAGAVAPLTSAVLASVDPRHTGSASGLNSAIARTGGLVATALLGAALIARGDALIAAFHMALLAAAACCLVASVILFILYRDPSAGE